MLGDGDVSCAKLATRVKRVKHVQSWRGGAPWTQRRPDESKRHYRERLTNRIQTASDLRAVLVTDWKIPVSVRNGIDIVASVGAKMVLRLGLDAFRNEFYRYFSGSQAFDHEAFDNEMGDFMAKLYPYFVFLGSVAEVQDLISRATPKRLERFVWPGLELAYARKARREVAMIEGAADRAGVIEEATELRACEEARNQTPEHASRQACQAGALKEAAEIEEARAVLALVRKSAGEGVLAGAMAHALDHARNYLYKCSDSTSVEIREYSRRHGKSVWNPVEIAIGLLGDLQPGLGLGQGLKPAVR